MRLLFLFISMLAVYPVLSQIKSLKCTIINAETLEPVPYATLGLPERRIGTNADENGAIVIRINEQNHENTDVWIISSIGYQTKNMLHSELLDVHNDTIYLHPLINILDEVVLNKSRLKPKAIGKKSHGALTHVNIYSVNDSIDDGLSQEFGVQLKLNNRCLIDDFNVFFSSNNFEHLKLQFLIYTVDGDSVNLLPNQQPLYYEAAGYGWNTLDLKNYSIELSEGKYAFTARIIEKSLEEQEARLSIPMTMPSFFNGFLFRQKSEDKWVLKNSANPSIYLNFMCENE